MAIFMKDTVVVVLLMMNLLHYLKKATLFHYLKKATLLYISYCLKADLKSAQLQGGPNGHLHEGHCGGGGPHHDEADPLPQEGNIW